MADDLPDVMMLGDYPFLPRGLEPEISKKVFLKTEVGITKALGSNIKRCSRMGSSAIPGMPGTPVTDVLVEVESFPLVEEELKAMAEAGYDYKGIAPHGDKDQWFFGGEGKPGHAGRVVVHVVQLGSTFACEMDAFIRYVKVTPSAFERYAIIKLEGARLHKDVSAENNPLIGYKNKKEKVCNEVRLEAIEWAKTHPA
eukprot:TRINITY_DN16604_c1_g1_i1.p1 TRINITY_DN16604_c1_g1~~TRINITY_DN16604_c1_g1_i1.p1  ORF type:complete len:217 (+),score=48.95 TRINITY_DN16604_c1_g1_i1:60-653(+)